MKTTELMSSFLLTIHEMNYVSFMAGKIGEKKSMEINTGPKGVKEFPVSISLK